MSPQHRGLVPDKLLAQILDARDRRDAAEIEYRELVVKALKSDASVREVAKATGLSTNTVARWGREGGWPTKAQKDRWAAEKAPRDEWAAQIAAAEKLLQHVDPEE